MRNLPAAGSPSAAGAPPPPGGETPTRYDLALFLALNEEYRQRRTAPQPPPMSDAPQRQAHKRRAARNIQKALSGLVDIRGTNVLDFGCGMGDLDLVLAEDFDCSVTGVDIRANKEWDRLSHPRVERFVTDLSEAENAARFAGRFDVVVSVSVLEHVHHPYQALHGLKTVLKPGGVAWIVANLYRGPLASHRYREVFFPWPHLLFTDEVFMQFYQHIGKPPRPASWVNKLTHLHYRDYLDRIGFTIVKESFSRSTFDEAFYARFEDVLGRYPRSDLERDFVTLVIRPREDAAVGRPLESASFRPLALPSRPRALTSHWSGGVECAIARQGDGAIRCEIAAGTDRRYGGIRLPTRFAGGLRIELELIDPVNIEAIYLDGEARDRRRFLRWEWKCSRDRPSAGRQSFLFEPGKVAGPFRSIDPIEPEKVEELHLFIRVKPGARAGFILHRAEITDRPQRLRPR